MTLIIIDIAASLVILVAAAYLLMTLYPAFGRRAGKQEQALNSRSLNYSKGKFAYPQTAELIGERAGGGGLSILKDFIKGNPRSRPAEPLQPLPLQPASIGQGPGTRVTWFGHSAVLLEMDGVTLFLDPMLGNAPSPFPFIGGRRYSKQLPLEISQLPQIDAVVLSHDHYDHLDYGTIRKLKDKVGLFIVPLGVGAHLRRWGVSGDKIREHDWGMSLRMRGLRSAVSRRGISPAAVCWTVTPPCGAHGSSAGRRRRSSTAGTAVTGRILPRLDASMVHSILR